MADTLLLNADGNPVSYMPLSTLTWEDAIKYMVLDKADVMLYHDNWIVRSARWETQEHAATVPLCYRASCHSELCIVFPFPAANGAG